MAQTVQVQKQKSPLNSVEINAKIENGQVRVPHQKRSQKAQQTTSKTQSTIAQKRGSNKAPSDEEFLAVLKQLHSKTGKAATSREISDAAGIKDSDFGRGAVRSAMRRLQKADKVNIEIQPEGKTKYRYTPK